MPRNPATFAKRQREMEQKRRAEEKRKKRVERKNSPKPEGGPEEEYPKCMPIVDE